MGEVAPITRPLRELRADRLLTVRGLARAAEVSVRTLYRAEAGEFVPRPAAMLRIAAALGVEPAAVAEFRARLPSELAPPVSDDEATEHLVAMGHAPILARRVVAGGVRPPPGC